LEGRVAIVTGGSSGFGRATAVRLASEGAKILVADLDRPGGEETIGFVGQIGGEGELFVGDIATQEGATRMMQHAVDRFGAADILVNNAGIAPQGESGRTWDMSEEAWDRVLRINLKSIYLCSRACIPHMLAKGKGAIVKCRFDRGVAHRQQRRLRRCEERNTRLHASGGDRARGAECPRQ
jgi:NAD(P)-dependent dehydrogenase (short-subunit alcohol dehydrogenase family)